MILWSTLQHIRSLNIQRRCRERRGDVAKEELKHSNYKVNNLINLLQLDPLHSTSNEFNDSGLNLKTDTGNLQLIKEKEITLQDYLLDNNLDIFLATETWLKDDKDKIWLLGLYLNKGEFKCLTSNRSDTKKGGALALI